LRIPSLSLPLSRIGTSNSVPASSRNSTPYCFFGAYRDDRPRIQVPAVPS
jgi:hypothetical protein